MARHDLSLHIALQTLAIRLVITASARFSKRFLYRPSGKLTIPSKNSIRARCQIKPTIPRDYPNGAARFVLAYRAPNTCYPIGHYCIRAIFQAFFVSTIREIDYPKQKFDTCPLPDKTDKIGRVSCRGGVKCPWIAGSKK